MGNGTERTGNALGAAPGDVQDVARVALTEGRDRHSPDVHDFDWRQHHDEVRDLVGLMTAAARDARGRTVTVACAALGRRAGLAGDQTGGARQAEHEQQRDERESDPVHECQRNTPSIGLGPHGLDVVAPRRG